MTGRMDCFGATDIGKQRPKNEDHFLIADLNKSLRIHHSSLNLDQQTRLFGNSQGNLFVVADGMGGHRAGERASTMALDGVVAYMLNRLRWFFSEEGEDDTDFREELKLALQHCQKLLRREIQAFPQHHGMGTTLTMAYVAWPQLYVAHVGDSRCYLHQRGKLRQLTRDHTLSQLYTETLGPSDRESEAMKHALWNVVGGSDDELHPEVFRYTLSLGDSLLLCTDGLTKHVSDEILAAELASDRPSRQLCERLIHLANDEGGSDNITVVIARFQRLDEDALEEAAELAFENAEEGLSDTVDFPTKPSHKKALS